MKRCPKITTEVLNLRFCEKCFHSRDYEPLVIEVDERKGFNGCQLGLIAFREQVCRFCSLYVELITWTTIAQRMMGANRTGTKESNKHEQRKYNSR